MGKHYYISILVISLLFLGCRKVNDDCNMNDYPNAPGIEWNTEVDGSEEESHGHYILSCSDGGFLQIGETGFIPNSAKILVVKTDENGNLIWKKEFGNGGNNLGNSAIETSDGYIVCGAVNENSTIIKLNKSDGSLLFQETANNGGNDAYEDLVITSAVNAQIDGQEVVFHDYADIGIAVSSPKGLMVPVVRNAEQMSLAEIEREIKRLAIKARDGKITPDDMTGGTFTITNGGVFGSMLSTPIINPPQSAILGMHNVVERPVAVNGKVEIRPIMYVALSYDHRVIDGKESVGFLVKVKEML